LKSVFGINDVVRAVHQIKLKLTKVPFPGEYAANISGTVPFMRDQVAEKIFAAKPSIFADGYSVPVLCKKQTDMPAEIFAPDKLRDELLMERFLIFRITCARCSVKENLLDIYRTSEADTDICFQKKHRQLSTCAYKACYQRVSHH